MAAPLRQPISGVITTPQEHWNVLFEGQRKAVVLWKAGRKAEDGREWYALQPEDALSALAACKGADDVYVTPNEFHGWRKSKLLASLNALWVDIDLRDTEETPVEAAEVALQKMRSAGLPDPNMVVYSGRGCHIYYLIKRTLPKALPRWQAAQRTLVQLVSGDPNAADCTRVLRLVGTRNNKAPSERQTVTGQVITTERYDFDWLLDQIMVPRGELRDIRAARAARAAARAAKGEMPRNAGSIYKVWYQRYQDIHRIVRANWGETVPEGYRDLILFHAAVCLSWFTHGYALPNEISKLAKRLTPTLSESEVDGITGPVQRKASDFEGGIKTEHEGRSVDPRYRYKSQTLYDLFAHLIENQPGLLDQLTSIIPDAERRKRRAERDAGRDRVQEGRYQAHRSVIEERQQDLGQRINELRQAGQSWAEIGKAVGLTDGAARLRHARWQRRQASAPAVARSAAFQGLDDRIAAHIKAGRSIREIAEIEGASKSTVGRRAAALSHLVHTPPSCMVAVASDFCTVFIENDQLPEGGSGGELPPVDNFVVHNSGKPPCTVPTKSDVRKPRRKRPNQGVRQGGLVEEARLRELRKLTFGQTIAKMEWEAREDLTYQPRPGAAQAGTRRYLVSTPDSSVVHEVLVTWPLWFDTRERKGGRDCISFVMYFGSLGFKEACQALD